MPMSPLHSVLLCALNIDKQSFIKGKILLESTDYTSVMGTRPPILSLSQNQDLKEFILSQNQEPGI